MKTINELISLENKNAIVTGGAGFIGLAICETLMELGASVSIFDKNEEGCLDRCSELNKKNTQNKAYPFIVDLSDEDNIRKSVNSCVDLMEGLDIIIHSAAFVGTTKYSGWAVPFDQQSVSAWTKAMNVNLTSAFILVQSAIPFLKNADRASIIFISSIYGVVAPDFRIYENTEMSTPAAYTASKAGLNQLCKYFSTLLSPTVRCNTITAGGVWRKQPDSFVKEYIKKTPLQRMAMEEDFKGAIAYLASDLSSYVTGSDLVVDGGFTTW